MSEINTPIVCIIFVPTGFQRNSMLKSIWKTLISLGKRMTMNKIAGKTKKTINEGRVHVNDGAKKEPPKNLILPKPTAAPKSPKDKVK